MAELSGLEKIDLAVGKAASKCMVFSGHDDENEFVEIIGHAIQPVIDNIQEEHREEKSVLKGALDTAIACGDAQREKIKGLELEVDHGRRLAFTEAGRYAKHLRTVDMDGTTAAYNIQHWCEERGIHGDEVTVCRKCGEGKVEFDSPDFLCKECWADWWVDGMDPETEEERVELKKETLENMAHSELERMRIDKPVKEKDDADHSR